MRVLSGGAVQAKLARTIAALGAMAGIGLSVGGPPRAVSDELHCTLKCNAEVQVTASGAITIVPNLRWDGEGVEPTCAPCPDLCRQRFAWSYSGADEWDIRWQSPDNGGPGGKNQGGSGSASGQTRLHSACNSSSQGEWTFETSDATATVRLDCPCRD